MGIYRPIGELVRSYELEALYPAKQLETIRLCRSEQTQVYAAEHFDGTFAFDLLTGIREYRPRAVEVPGAVSRSIDWPVGASST